MGRWRTGLILALLAGCTSGPKGDLAYIQDDSFRIGGLSPDKAWATGTACALTQHDALIKAQEIAAFNLRGVTGSGRYRVEFQAGRAVPGENQTCWEVRAQAVPNKAR